MASSFIGVSLGNVIELNADDTKPFWEPNDPTIRSQLAYGGVSVQDLGYRESSMALTLYLPSQASYSALLAKSGLTGSMVYDDVTFTGVTLTVGGPVKVYPDGAVSCSARCVRLGWS